MTLIGPTVNRPGDDSTRIPIYVDVDVVRELVELLYLPFMHRVGYSEFIARAIRQAYEEARVSAAAGP